MLNFKKIILVLFLVIMFCISISSIHGANITINPQNNSLSNVVNNYDTIYLADGLYNGSLNREIYIKKNTTIVGLNKGGATIDAEGRGYIFNVNYNTSLTLINLTLARSSPVIAIYNFGNLNIKDSKFIYNFVSEGVIRNKGTLSIDTSSFDYNWGNAVINSYTGNDIIVNTQFNNNLGGSDGIIIFQGDNRNILMNNLTFVNNSAFYSLIILRGSNLNLNLHNSLFINSNASIFTTERSIMSNSNVVSKVNTVNIREINTMVNYNPVINLNINLKKSGNMIFKASLRDMYGMILPNQRLHFYVGSKLLGSAITNKNGIATFNFKRNNLNFNIQIVLNGSTVKNSTTTIIHNGASFKGVASKFVVGKPKIVFKLKSTVKKGKLIYKKYHISNNGDSLGSKTFKKKIPFKYKFVKYTSKKVTFSYKLSTKTFSAKVKNQLPYKFNKKSLGVLTLVIRKK